MTQGIAGGAALGVGAGVATGGLGFIAGGLAASWVEYNAMQDAKAALEEMKRDYRAAKLNFDTTVAACPCIPKHSINLACESR